MAVDIAQLGFAVDSGSAAHAAVDLDKMSEAGKRAEQMAARMSTGVTAAAKKAQDAAGGLSSRSVEASNNLRKMGQAVAAMDGPLGGVASRLRSTSQLIRETSVATVLMTTALGAAVLAAQRFLAGFADTWSDLNARIGLAIGNMESSSAVMDRMATVARRTYSSLEATSESFLRNATTLRELGKTTVQQLDYTEALNNALVVSGAKAERAIMVQEALGRAMALGALRGQELNTVIQTGGRVAEVIAEQMGVGVNQLRNLGMQGKITGDVIYDALTSRLVQLREEAERMPATISDAFTLLRNSALQVVGVYDQAGNLSESLALAIISLADNLNVLVQAATIAVLVFGGRLVSALAATASASAQYYHAIATGSAVVIGSATAEKQRTAEILKSTGATYTAALAKQQDIQATIAQLEVTRALATVQRAEAASQVDRERATRAVIASRMALRNAELQLVEAKLAVAAADRAATAAEVSYQAAVAKTTLLGRAATVATGGLSLAMRGLSAALALVGGPVGLLFTVLTAMWIYKDRAVEIGNTTISVGNILDAIWTTVKEAVVGTVTAVGRLGVALWQFVTGQWTKAAETAKSAWNGVGNSIERVKDKWNAIDVSRLTFAAGMPADVQMPITGGAGVRDPNAGKDLSDYDKLIEQIKKRTEALKIESATFSMSEAAALRYKVMNDLLAEATKANIDITPTLIANHQELANAIGGVTAQIERQRVERELMTPDEVFADQVSRLKELYGEDAENFRQYQVMKAQYELERFDQTMRMHQVETDMRRKTLDMTVGLLNQFGNENKKAAIAAIVLSKTLAAADIIVSTARASMAAAASAAIGGPFAAAAAAASMKALGAAQLAIVAASGGLEIASLGKSSSSMSSASIGGGSYSSSIASVPTASDNNAKPSQSIYINIEGEKVSRKELEQLVERLNEYSRDGGKIYLT
ncbi:hypothetical protein APY04_0838 [Hyphomicrobium sulfonivorans]|uniref:Tape measure protein N-terminal domain-containing protein n=1 Tax=Hyphomicrobium sulfonivorans TaxID=121290 RepID=A0A109BL18_HYPSL|nr:tape measure protein [Hyphomicrobium sulfonivorans]KWT70777.1 hypothetical protein APY04_0838 [Hyphomicrobium sulfonivorans]